MEDWVYEELPVRRSGRCWRGPRAVVRIRCQACECKRAWWLMAWCNPDWLCGSCLAMRLAVQRWRLWS